MMPTIHSPSGPQTDLFGPQQPQLWEITNIRWNIEAGEYAGQKCILRCSFDTDKGERFGRVILADTREEIVLPVTAFRLDMETVIPPGTEPFKVRRPRTAIPPHRTA